MPGLTTRLVVGFCILNLIALLGLILIIVSMMRFKMENDADLEMSRQGRTLQTMLAQQETLLASEALAFSRYEGVSLDIEKDDRAGLERLFGPELLAHEITSLYVMDRQGKFIVDSQAGPSDEQTITRLPLVSEGFGNRVDSQIYELGGSLWLGAVAPHQASSGAVDAVFLLAKRIDGTYLQSLRSMLGYEVVLGQGSVQAASFDPPAPAFSPNDLRSDGQTDGPLGFSFRSLQIDGTSYRAFAFAYRSGGATPLNILLLQPTADLNDTLWIALTRVLQVSLGITALGALLAFLYARGVIGPLNRLAMAATSIAGGDLNQPVVIDSNDEVGELASAFEEMRIRVREMLEQEKRWNAELEDKVHAKTAELEGLCELRDQLLQETLTVQEEERIRVARELHDETCQSLTAIIANLAVAKTLPADQARERLIGIRKSVADTLQEVNRIVLDLRPTLLTDFGLAPALSWYAEQRLGRDVSVQLSTSAPDLRLPSNVETTLFRIGQEAIANVAKYSHARHVQINLVQREQDSRARITLEIKDDGCGFEPAQVQAYSNSGRRRLGLLGMRERLGPVGGELEVESAPGKGTCIRATVPFGNAQGREEIEG